MQFVDLSARDPAGAHALRVWHRYSSARRRERMRLAAAGIVWAVAWSVMAYLSYRDEEENTRFFLMFALTGWIGIFPAVRGTGLGLTLRLTVITAASAVALRSHSAAGFSPVAAAAWIFIAINVPGLMKDLRAQVVPLRGVRLRDTVYLLAPDDQAFTGLVARQIQAAVMQPRAAAASLPARLSPRDATTVRFHCPACGARIRTPGTGDCRRQCARGDLIVISRPSEVSSGDDDANAIANRRVPEAARRVS